MTATTSTTSTASTASTTTSVETCSRFGVDDCGFYLVLFLGVFGMANSVVCLAIVITILFSGRGGRCGFLGLRLRAYSGSADEQGGGVEDFS
jgi:hypothetical protein